jgi:phage-related protein
LQLFWNKLHNLAILIGTTVLPYMSQLVGGLMPLLDAVGAFAKANPGLVAAAVAIGSIVSAVVLALPVIAVFIVSVGVLKGALAGIGLAALGPIALVVAAIVGLGAAFVLAWQRFEWFREGIKAGLAGIVQGWQGAFDIIKGIITGDSDLITKGWNTMIEGIKKATAAGFQFTMQLVGSALSWIVQQIFAMPGRIGAGVRAIGLAIGNGIASAVRSILTAMFNWIGSKINGAVDAINFLIRAANKVPGISIPVITRIPTFAQGGTVDRPTLAMIGEGGEREYIVPESKMAAASSRFLGGARGASVIPSSPSSGAANGISPIQIAITTGPVMQDQSGQRWMTIEDGERLARQTAEQVQRQLRTPGGRYAAGVR